MDAFATEIRQQPEALHTLATFYADAGRTRLDEAARDLTAPLLTGMGASYHAAAIMVQYWHHLGVGGTAMEATDVINYGEWQRRHTNAVIYLSQSGASAEVLPLTDGLSHDHTLIGVTNDELSPLARRATLVLPLLAGRETLVACKTYVNALALLWLLGRRAAGRTDGHEVTTLARVADGIAALLARDTAIAAQWLGALGDAERLIFVGHGPHAVTARHCAMMAAEWAKRAVLSLGVGAFRHGFVEIVRPGDGIVVFAPPGAGAASARALAGELAGYGGRVLVVAQGETYTAVDVPRADGEEQWLSPLLDVIPAQLFVHALAAASGVPPGFQRISKVTTQL